MNKKIKSLNKPLSRNLAQQVEDDLFDTAADMVKQMGLAKTISVLDELLASHNQKCKGHCGHHEDATEFIARITARLRERYLDDDEINRLWELSKKCQSKSTS